ncbi:MAG: putative restriction endonuclease [Verrucomicrobia bacterium]|jgi:Uma2 family endonuclease|nr:MAG: putative restriction endonuclease [Verrucomicrobiota bacterium]
MDPKNSTEDEPSESSWESYRPPVPDTSHLITETEEPVDNLFSEKQMRLLTESLYASWEPGRPFWVAANVGLYEALNAKAVVPDVFLSMDTTSEQAKEFGSKCYFFWDHGKPPEVVIEIVSNADGGELDRKLARYAKLHVNHYVVFDPFGCLSSEVLQAYVLCAGSYEKRPRAEAFSTVAGLQLRLWTGVYEGQTDRWLRWADDEGEIIPTGAERAKVEAARAKAEAERAKAEAARAKAEAARATAEAERADAEMARADSAARRAEALAARLRELGVDPGPMTGGV